MASDPCPNCGTVPEPDQEPVCRVCGFPLDHGEGDAPPEGA